MIVGCNNCGKRYKVADDKIPPEGRKFKCPNCQSIIFAYRPFISESEQKEVVKEEGPTAEPRTKCPACGSTSVRKGKCMICGSLLSKPVNVQQEVKKEKENVELRTPTPPSAIKKNTYSPLTIKIIKSSQFPYGITIPSLKWRELKKNTLHNESDIEMSNEENEGYCMTIVQPAEDHSLQEMKEACLRTWQENDRTLQMGGEQEIKLGASTAAMMIHSAQRWEIIYKHLHTIIVERGLCIQIICWSPEKDFSANFDDFNRIVNSFTFHH